MDHKKYHAIRGAAVTAFGGGDSTALAAITESGDMMFHGTDWSAWNDEQRIVYGIMTGLQIAKPDVAGRAFLKSREADLCEKIVGDREIVHEIAKMVWKDLN